MTTGRINQVTIFERGAVTARSVGAPAPREARVGVSQVGGVTGPPGRPPAPRTESQRRAAPTIHLPRLNSPRRGPPKSRGQSNSQPGLPHAHLERRLPVDGHIPGGTATGLRACPRVRRDIVGQGPLIHRLPSARDRRGRRIRLRASPPRAPRVGGTNGQGRDSARTMVKCVPRRDSAVAVSVGGGARIDVATSGRMGGSI